VPDTNHVTLTAAEVAIIKKFREADLIDALTCYDDHGWKMLIVVARQLAARPKQHNHRQQQTRRETTHEQAGT
jgi:hypothetical protein